MNRRGKYRRKNGNSLDRNLADHTVNCDSTCRASKALMAVNELKERKREC